MFLLFGLLVIGFGMWGVFSAIMAQLGDSPLSEAYSGEAARQVPEKIGLARISGIFGHWLWSVVENACFPIAIGALAILSIGLFVWRRPGDPSIRPLWAVIGAMWSIALALVFVFVVMNLRLLAEAYWWTFLLGGFMWCLLVILFNTEELTDRWLQVCMRFSAFIGILVVLLVSFFYLATSRATAARFTLSHDQQSHDQTFWREIVERYADNLTPTTEEAKFRTLLATSDELVNSEREIALTAAMFIHKKAATSGPTAVPGGGNGGAILSEVLRREAFATVFPPPVKPGDSGKRWKAAVESLLPMAPGTLTFEQSLARSMFANEGLCLHPVYRTYLATLRREQIPFNRNLRREVLDKHFDGTLDELKEQFRIRTLDELQSPAMPAHCEVIYIDSRNQGYADLAVRELRKHGFIVPRAENPGIAKADKYPRDQVAVFANPGSGEIAALQKICETLSFINTGQRGLLPSVDKISLASKMDYAGYKPFNETRTSEIGKSAALSSATGPDSLQAARELGIFREIANVSTYLLYGRPEKHFEVWILGDPNQRARIPEQD